MCIGLFSLLLGIWGTFDNILWKETWSTLGKTMLASGIFAGILKLMQISGVFKEELEKLIFEPKFLKNRTDIPEYWDKISQELFKNKFPNISKKLLSDIKDTYFPTKSIIYYDQIEHFIEIEIDANDNLTIRQKTSLDIICSSKSVCFDYQFFNTLNFKTDKSEVSYVTNYIKINGSPTNDFKHEQLYNNKQLTNKFSVNLRGSDKYEIEREELKVYSLITDNSIYFTASKLSNTLSLSITHPKNLELKFNKLGTLKTFVEKQNNSTFKKYVYKDIIYPEQGYVITMNKL